MLTKFFHSCSGVSYVSLLHFAKKKLEEETMTVNCRVSSAYNPSFANQ